MNNELKEIKKCRLLKSESFIYTFSSKDNLTASNMIYEIDFGGGELNYDNYQCEVINAGHTGRVRADLHWYFLVMGGINNNGNFFRNRLPNREVVLCTLPTGASGDQYLRFTGSSGITFNLTNCRIKQRVKMRFIRPDFLLLASGSDINIGGVNTEWFVTLKMTPIVDY